MPNTTVYTNNQYYQDIAAAIRSKNGQTASYKPSEMASAINLLPVSGSTVSLQDRTVTPTAATQTITPSSGYGALRSVTVNAVPATTSTFTTNGVKTPPSGQWFSVVTISVPTDASNNQDKVVTSSTVTQTISADAGYTGLGTVTINAIATTTQATPTATITNSSGIISATATQPAGYVVAGTKTGTAQLPVQTGTTITPTESAQTAVASYKWTTGTITVAAIPTTYVGSGITKNPTLTVSGATVTAPAGYYSTAASKSVATATAGTISVGVNSSGLMTATAIAPAGYFAGGTKTATAQLSTQADATIVPSEETQTLTVSGKYMLGNITVEAIETESATAVSNGMVYPSTGKYLSQVTVAVPSDIHNQNKEITPTESAQTVSADIGYSGLGTVTVKAISQTYVGSAITKNPTPTVNGKVVTVPVGYYNTAQTVTIGNEYIVPTGTTTITSNGTYNVTAYASAKVNIPSDIHNQTKTVTPTESVQTVSADTGYSGLSVVTVNAISSTYVGSGITQNPSLTASGATVTAPAGYYSTASSKSVTTVTQATPTATIANATGIISATATQGAGYVTAGTKTGTTQLTVQAGKTVTPTATTQTAVAAYRWTTGTITVAAVPTDTSNTFSANGTYTPASGKWFDEITIAVPSGINNEGAKTVTPSTATQTITPGTGYSGLSKVTVNPIPSNYITTSDANATASQILAPKTAYVNGVKLTGSMPDNGATGGTITTQGGTYSIPAGYTSGGTVTASLPVSTITNGVLNVATFTETVGTVTDYGVRATITIPAGYYNTTTLSRDLSSILPVPAQAATVGEMLSNYEAYDYEGHLLVGTMTNNAAWNATLDQTTTSVTIPEGYHNGSGKVSHTTVNIPDPTFSMNNSTGVITASATWTRGFTTDNSYSKTYSLTTQAGTTITPTESMQTAVAANRWTTGTVTVAAISSTYVGSGVATRSSADLTVNGATVTAPAGYYAANASKSVASMTVPTATSASGSGTKKITVTPSTTSQYINLPTGYNSATAYFQINAMTAGSATPQATISATGATVTAGNNTLTFSKSITLTPQVTAGYISAGTAAARTVSLTATVTTKAAATYTPGTAAQTISANQYLTGIQTIAGDADLIGSNIISTANIFGVQGTVVINKYYTGTTAPAASLGNNGDIYFQSGGSL